MRSLVPDSKYFQYLDGIRAEGVSTALAPIYLMREFPILRSEEAKAICTDWRARRRSDAARRAGPDGVAGTLPERLAKAATVHDASAWGKVSESVNGRQGLRT